MSQNSLSATASYTEIAHIVFRLKMAYGLSWYACVRVSARRSERATIWKERTEMSPFLFAACIRPSTIYSDVFVLLELRRVNACISVCLCVRDTETDEVRHRVIIIIFISARENIVKYLSDVENGVKIDFVAYCNPLDKSCADFFITYTQGTPKWQFYAFSCVMHECMASPDVHLQKFNA